MLSKLRNFLWRLAKRHLATGPDKALLDSLAEPHRWAPTEDFTHGEKQSWGVFLRGPFGRKLDLAMYNWAQQQAQRAMTAPTSDLARWVGFAHGARAGWEMAKTISRTDAADASHPEHDGVTVPSPLEHLRP